jgi:hypothetical protein
MRLFIKNIRGFPWLIIANHRYFYKHAKDIEQWANTCTPGWKIEGGILMFKEDEHVTSFLLRWG